MKIVSALKKNDVVLLEVGASKLHKEAIALLKGQKDKKIAYITCNKTAKALMGELKTKKIPTKNILFVDVISETISKVKKHEQCVFIHSPAALNDLGIVINSALKQEIDLIIIDTITNFSIYNPKQRLERFVASMVNKIKESGKKAVFLASDSEEHQNLIRKIETFVDVSVKVK